MDLCENTDSTISTVEGIAEYLKSGFIQHGQSTVLAVGLCALKTLLRECFISVVIVLSPTSLEISTLKNLNPLSFMCGVRQ